MEEAWKELRYRLTQIPVLRYSDLNKLFVFYIYANKKGIEVVLCQKNKDVRADYIIQYYSRTLTEG